MKNSKTKQKKQIPNWLAAASIIVVLIIIVVVFVMRSNRPKQIVWTEQNKAEMKRFIEDVRAGRKSMPVRGGFGPMRGPARPARRAQSR